MYGLKELLFPRFDKDREEACMGCERDCLEFQVVIIKGAGKRKLFPCVGFLCSCLYLQSHYCFAVWEDLVLS